MSKIINRKNILKIVVEGRSREQKQNKKEEKPIAEGGKQRTKAKHERRRQKSRENEKKLSIKHKTNMEYRSKTSRKDRQKSEI